MPRFLAILTVILLFQPLAGRAETYTLPLADLQQIIDASGDSPDAAIRGYLAGLLRDELDSLGFDVNAGLLIDEFPVDEVTRVIETDCNFPRPYEIHTDATTASVTLDDGSGLTVGLDSIRSISLHADLIGSGYAETTAWVRWGQDIPFGRDCVKFETDHGWVAMTLPFDIDIDLALDLNPSFDAEQIAIVIDKQASVSGQAAIVGGDLQHDFGVFSLTDLLISIFEDELLAEVQSNGEQAFADEIVALNFRLDGRDENGNLDPTIDAFNGPTVFALSVDPEDESFVRDLLAQLGIPEYVIELINDRGIEVLLQLAILEGAEREAYLAQLGANASCDLLLENFESQLQVTPLYSFDGQACVAASLSGTNTSPYYSDAQCFNEVAYRPRSDTEYCATHFGPDSDIVLGNAAAWQPEANQPDDPLRGFASRSWTTSAGTQIDIGAVQIADNHQPFIKQLRYRSILGVPRGNGECQLEMRVYKSDITASGLRPLVALHGGTWRGRGFSFSGMEAGITEFTERGFIVFAPFYRLVDTSDGNSECNAASWRELTADVEAALDWVTTNGAALGAADGPVDVYGQSAGAHLAAWLAANEPDLVRKALLFYGPLDALQFLEATSTPGGPYESYRHFGLRSLSRLFGARGGEREVDLGQIDSTNISPAVLIDEWSTRIPDMVFDLSRVDAFEPPFYLTRCAGILGLDPAVLNLVSPPAALLNCLKEDLRDFLVANSFRHQLADEAVPLHIVHGSADELVPFSQALGMCESIDGNSQPSEITEPLTSYACGSASEVQIVKDAEHALELGVCVETLCPAGPPGSSTRAAVQTAVSAAYDWLLVEPPPPDAGPSALLSLPDIDGNGAPELAVLFRGSTNHVQVIDAADGALIQDIGFGSDPAIDFAELPDLNGSGHPEIAMLGVRPSGQVRVQVNDSMSGAQVSRHFFGDQYSAIQMAVLNDYDGAGLPEIAVLGHSQSSNSVRVMVRDAATDMLLDNVYFGNKVAAQTLLALPGLSTGNIDKVAVLGVNAQSSQVQVQVRNPVTKSLDANVFFGSAYAPIGLAAVDDPGSATNLALLGSRHDSARVRTQIRDSQAAGPPSANIYSGSIDAAIDLVAVADINANGAPELAVLFEKPTGAGLVRLYDSSSGSLIGNLFFNAFTDVRAIVVLPDFSGNNTPEIAVLGATLSSVELQIRDASSGAMINTIVVD